jgi:sensor c-di-GMP phosphodiesterase-like protein
MTATHTPITLAALAMMMTTTNQTSEISSLSQKATELAKGLTHWNVTYVVFLGLTVVMSAAALVASVFIVWGNIRLSKVQTNLATAIEGELRKIPKLR